MNFLYPSFPFPSVLMLSGKVEIARCLLKPLLPFFAYVASLYFPDAFAVWRAM